MKFVSWNVNGLRACAGKGFADAFNSLDADFFCLQETKMQPGQLDMEFEGYKSYWNSAEKKGYSGTAVTFRAMQPAIRTSRIARNRGWRSLRGSKNTLRAQPHRQRKTQRSAVAMASGTTSAWKTCSGAAIVR